MDVIPKLILNSPVVKSLNCNSASGVLKGLICDICELSQDVCYKHAAKYKSDIDDIVKLR